MRTSVRVVEREVLERWIAEGLSVEEIGRRVDRHPSTVAYWMDKFGLRSAHAHKHAPRGPIGEAELAELVARDLTVRQIATAVGRSATSVRYWLQRHGLRTTYSARATRTVVAGPERVVVLCQEHGESEHVVRDDGRPRCARCAADSVTRWRRRAKQVLVDEAGGRCRCCGYDRCLAALTFHHVDPSTKRFGVGGRGLTRSMAILREEAAKCVLLCANCHAEVEAGVLHVEPIDSRMTA
jgi:transposase